MDENETRLCNPSLPVELVGEAEKIKGDAIGNTLYSQRWVLKVVLKMLKCSRDGEFDEELEKDLCLLWDMTVEEDVVLFLIHNDILELIAFILEKEQEPRLMEILVGMLGNLCVVAEVCRQAMNSAPVCELMGKMLFCSDSMTLVQLMRLYVTCLQWLRDSKHHHQVGNPITEDDQKSSETNIQNSEHECSENQNVCELDSNIGKKQCVDKPSSYMFMNMLLNTDSWYNQISFLLQSSTNGTLLTSMLHMLDDLYLTLADWGTLPPAICTAEMIAAVVEALKELKASISASRSDDDASRKAIFHSVSVLSHFVDSEQGTAALGEMCDVLSNYMCNHIDEQWLCCSLSLECVQLIMRLLNVLGCTFMSLTSKTEVTCWLISLLGHLTERNASKQRSLSGEDGFEAKDQEEEEKYFDSKELTLAVENICIFVVKCLSGNSDKVKWQEMEETVQERCKHQHLIILRSVLQKHGIEEEIVCIESS